MFRIKFSLVFLLFLLISCGEGLIEEKTSEPIITSISPKEIFLGDTIIIEGSGFGIKNHASFLWFISETDSLIISSIQAISWSPNLIKFKLDFQLNSSEIWVGLDSKIPAKKEINILPYPNITTIDISSGTFTQGNELGFIDERNVRQVELSRNFEVATTELSQKIWNLVNNYNNSPIKNDYLPVSNVTWNEAILFCNKLSTLYGLDTCYSYEGDLVSFDYDANGWRLPTESEWEYIAFLSNIDVENIENYAWFNDNSGYNSQIISTKQKDQIGLNDLYGNVWEWCWDFYKIDYDLSETKDPVGQLTGQRHVKRGGAFNLGKIYCSKSNRSTPSSNITSTGLRLVRNK